MRTGKLDLGMYGPFSYILAADTANAEAAILASYEDMGIIMNPILLHIRKRY